MKTIDLNCDMGEGSTEAEVLSELAMLDIVSSANVSCGAHAGDARLMSRVMQTADTASACANCRRISPADSCDFDY